MTATELLEDLSQRNIEVHVSNGTLRLKPRASVTPDLVGRLRACKAELVAAITAEQERARYRQQIHLMLDCLAAACPKGWRLTDEDSMTLDEVEQMVVDARRQRNQDKFLEALTQYERTALAAFSRWKSRQDKTAISGTS